VWLGDWVNGRILKFDPSSDQLTWWENAGLGALPVGLAFDASDNLWWADFGLDAIVRLEPQSDLQTTYALSVGTDPTMIAIANDGLVWYTESVSGTVGSLSPAQAGGVSSTLYKATIAVTHSCSDLGAGTTSSINTQSGTAAWSDAVLTTLVEGGAWRVYQLPPNGSPWGVISSMNSTFVVDQGRQKLLRIPHKHTIYLPHVVKN
jgi:DNA-binding beta-propeller fold protein YncE